MKKICLSLLLLFIFNSDAWAQEFVYVTDSLQLRVYAGPSTDSEFLQTIDSGDSVEVFETQDGFSKVATYDGTVGWVKSAFLVEEPPAKLLYYSVGEKNKQLEAEINALKNNTDISLTDRESQAESNSELSEADTNQITELQTALEEQQKINQELQQLLDENRVIQSESESGTLASNNNATSSQQILKSVNKKGWLTGLAAALIVGLLLGFKYTSWRMKKRFHGFRF